MDAYPLGVNPGTKINDGGKLIGVWILAGGQHCVQFPEERVELSLKSRQFFSNLGRVHAVVDADAHLDFFESRLTAERANKTCVGRGEVFHQQRLPALRRSDSRELPPLCGANNLIEDLAEVPA